MIINVRILLDIPPPSDSHDDNLIISTKAFLSPFAWMKAYLPCMHETLLRIVIRNECQNFESEIHDDEVD